MVLKIEVVDIKGHCPVYSVGDTFYLKAGYILESGLSCSVCLHSLASILPYYNAIGHGVDPQILGLTSEPGKPARVQCLDPCGYTGGGTVVLEMKRMEDDEIECSG